MVLDLALDERKAPPPSRASRYELPVLPTATECSFTVPHRCAGVTSPGGQDMRLGSPPEKGTPEGSSDDGLKGPRSVKGRKKSEPLISSLLP